MEDCTYVACKDNKAYSPRGVRNLVAQAEKDNHGNLQAVLDNKHKYKNLWELWHGSVFALALHKQFGKDYKFNLCMPENDPPDLYFLQTDGNGFFPVEIMELYKRGETFKNSTDLTNHIWRTKGLMCYETCYLLLVSRLSVDNFDVTKLISEMKNFSWKFQRIYISFYIENLRWLFFEVFPPTPNNDKIFLSYDFDHDKKYYY
jgi:hypothetical protein